MSVKEGGNLSMGSLAEIRSSLRPLGAGPNMMWGRDQDRYAPRNMSTHMMSPRAVAESYPNHKTILNTENDELVNYTLSDKLPSMGKSMSRETFEISNEDDEMIDNIVKRAIKKSKSKSRAKTDKKKTASKSRSRSTKSKAKTASKSKSKAKTDKKKTASKSRSRSTKSKAKTASKSKSKAKTASKSRSRSTRSKPKSLSKKQKEKLYDSLARIKN